MAIHQNDVIYFILTDRFYGENVHSYSVDKNNPRDFHGGDFAGIIEKIPYLKKLGITALWITPVYLQVPEGNNTGLFGYHGYWALDFNQVEPRLYVENEKYPKGSKLYLKDLVDILHKNGIKLVLDMVVNHTGYHHPCFSRKVENPTPIKKCWFNVEPDYYDEQESSLSGLPDMDLDQSDVADYHVQTIISWIKETGIDGIRMDTAKHIESIFWTHYKTQVKGKYPDVSLIGEVLNFNVDDISRYQKYWAFDSLFDFPLQKAIEWVFVFGNSCETFVSSFNKGTGILEKDDNYTNHNRLTTLLDNHDLSGRFFTWALKSVDGNREAAAAIQCLALSFLFTVRGIPQIYYGTEIGMEGEADPDNRRDMEWHKFTTQHEVRAEFPVEKSIFNHTKKLIEIRKQNEALTFGAFVNLYVSHTLLVFLRYFDENAVIVVIHNGWQQPTEPVHIYFDSHPYIPTRIKALIQNRVLKCQLTGKEINVENGNFYIQPEGKTAMILK